MKHPMKQLLALVLALILALPGLALSEEDAELVTLPEQEVTLEDQDGPELDVEGLDVEGLDAEALDDLSLELDLGGDEALEIPGESGLDETAEAEPDDSIQDNGELADNAWDYVELKYIDAKGKQMDPVKCAKLTGGSDYIIGNGWFAVTGDISYSASMIVWGDTNLILCDGAKLNANGGIWVQKSAKLTIWAQSTGKKMGKLVANGDEKKAGIGGISHETAGTIIINGGDIHAASRSYGASIGGGYWKDSGFRRIEINGGEINAPDGIGRGYKNENRGDIVITGGRVTSGDGHHASIDGDKVTISGNEARGDFVKATSKGEKPGITANVVTIESGKVEATAQDSGAGIGGAEKKSGGTIIINGGTVTATSHKGAGIGGGKSGESGTITINGGTVTATSTKYGAGIGSSRDKECKDITITGGTVTAVGGSDGGAGIGGGGGYGSLTGTITIKGGTVSAYGNGGGAGIGAGYSGNARKGHVNITGGKVVAWGSQRGAGIGGGRENPFGEGGEGAQVSITHTADVIAYAGGRKEGDRCSAIGHGDNDEDFGTLWLADDMMVRANWDDKKGEADEPFPWGTRVKGCQYRWYAHIQPCDHRNATYSNITEKTHTVDACKYCKMGSRKEAHKFNPKTGKCRLCGYERKAAPTTTPVQTVTPTSAPTMTPTPAAVTVTFDSNGGDGRMDAQKLTAGKAAKLNANTFTCRWNTFKGWNTERDGSGKSYADGAKVKLEKDVTLYAQWYVNVILIAYRRQVIWTGKPQSVEGFRVLLESNTDYVVEDAVFEGVTASCTATEIGLYPVEIKGATVNKTTDRDGKYIVTGIRDGSLMILKAQPSIEKPRARQLTYNGKDQALIEAGKTEDGLILYSLNRENWSRSVPTGKNAGTYTIFYRVVGDWRHENSQTWSVKATIAKAKLTVTADNLVKYYGDPDPKLTYTVSGQLYGDDKLTGELTRTKGEEIGGIYRIKIGTLTAGRNYDIDFIEGHMAIVRPPQPIDPIPTIRPTAKPTVTPKPTAKPTAKPTVTPTVTPKPTVKPIITPKPTEKPTAKPTQATKPTVRPYRPEGDLPVVTAKPTVTPKPTAKPTVKPTVTPKPTAKPTAKPTVTPKPQPKPDQSDFTLLAQMKASGSDGTVLKLSWTKVDGADGYDIYFAKGGATQVEFYRHVSAPATQLEITDLEKRATYRACVLAWKREKGELTVIGRNSPFVYAITGGYDDDRCNPQSVKLDKRSVTLEVGASDQLSASVKGVRADRPVLNLESDLRYYSSDRSVATVTDTGEITAVGAGSCTVYILATNGIRAGVKVTVK